MSGALLSPLGGAVSLWGKRRIVELRREGCEQPAIASQLGVSCSTVKRVLGEAGEDGDVSAPRQGAGKLNDSRWIFAGPRGHGNLVLLERRRRGGRPHSNFQISPGDGDWILSYHPSG